MPEDDAITKAIATLEAAIGDPTSGLPQEVFFFMTRITPSVNVDLLIRNPLGQTLLAWRSDQFAGSGWHIPGGILRYKETLENRVKEVAISEIGRELRFNPAPIAIKQMWKKRATRGHFVSILFECFTDEVMEPKNDGKAEGEAGFLQWHQGCPDNLIEVHEKIYRPYISAAANEAFTGTIPFDYFPNL